MKAIHKRLIKLEEFIERRDAPRISVLLRERRAARRANQGMPPNVPRRDTRDPSIADILRDRRASAQAKQSEGEKSPVGENRPAFHGVVDALRLQAEGRKG